jgi:hypothetical protein
MGKMPTVLKMATQINHASWLWRALFHMAISFHTPSQMQWTFHIRSLVDGFSDQTI